MKQKLIAMKNAILNGKKNDKGFTLVELVVVIVILAILMGVTIGGVFTYVNQSRVNTDANNAASIQSALSTLSANEEVYKWAKASGSSDVTVKWVDACVVDSSATDALDKAVQTILTDGLPKSQTGNGFELKITRIMENSKATGDVSISCKVLETAPDSASGLADIGMKAAATADPE